MASHFLPWKLCNLIFVFHFLFISLILTLPEKFMFLIKMVFWTSRLNLHFHRLASTPPAACAATTPWVAQRSDEESKVTQQELAKTLLGIVPAGRTNGKTHRGPRDAGCVSAGRIQRSKRNSDDLSEDPSDSVAGLQDLWRCRCAEEALDCRKRHQQGWTGKAGLGRWRLEGEGSYPSSHSHGTGAGAWKVRLWSAVSERWKISAKLDTSGRFSHLLFSLSQCGHFYIWVRYYTSNLQVVSTLKGLILWNKFEFFAEHFRRVSNWSIF